MTEKEDQIKELEARIAALKGPAPDIVETVLARAEDGAPFRAEGLVPFKDIKYKVRLVFKPNDITVTAWVRGHEWSHTYPYADFKTASDYYHVLIEKHGLVEVK